MIDCLVAGRGRLMIARGDAANCAGAVINRPQNRPGVQGVSIIINAAGCCFGLSYHSSVLARRKRAVDNCEGGCREFRRGGYQPPAKPSRRARRVDHNQRRRLLFWIIASFKRIGAAQTGG